jgi:beta-N-acetylhexosaminidase
MALAKMGKTRLVALFGPEHGYAGSAPDVVPVDSSKDRSSALPIYSLYGKTQKPSREMLEGIEVLIFDIQDVGVRFYTYVQTMSLAMEAASEKAVQFVVLDRPNPLTGAVVEGNVLDAAFSSFLGRYPIALRHGMTVGELAKLFNEHFQINADLSVVEMTGWRREMWYDDTGLVWVPPSPGMPSLGTAIVYPGTCLLEGTNVSEGRGTSLPFELIGAPWIDGEQLAGRLRGMKLEGALVRSAEFIPSTAKYRGKRCRGIQVHVTDRNLFKPVKFGLTLISTIRDLYSNHFDWILDESSRRFHFDLLMGTDKLRSGLESERSLSEIFEEWNYDVIKFKEIRREFLLYPDRR